MREHGGVVSFRVRVQARASRSGIAGEWQGALRIWLAAPPVEGRANDALRQLLASGLNVPAGAVKITQGEHSRTKRIEIRGTTEARVRAMIAAEVEQGPPETRN